MWFWKRKKVDPDPAPPRIALADAINELRSDVKALRRDLDDLDETFRSFRGRQTKVAALEAAKEPESHGARRTGGLTNGPQQPIPFNRAAEMARLKREGKWPG